MDLTIQHDQNNHRFFVEKNNEISELKYKKIDAHTLDYYSTFVPEDLRDQGIAAQITEYALNYAMNHHFKVKASCPYVAHYFDRHPKYQMLLKE